MLFTYAYDGSGVALRTRAIVLATGSQDTVLVSFPDYTPPPDISRRPGTEPNTWEVRADALTPIGSLAPLASFNWLD